MKDKHEDDGVELQSGTLEPHAERKVVQNPVLIHPVGHDSIHAQ